MRKFAPIDEASDHRGRPVRQRHGHHGPDDFFRLDVERMSPGAQVAASLVVLIPVVLGAAFVLTRIPFLWWMVFVFGWTIFPAFGLLARGVAGLFEERRPALSSVAKEEQARLATQHGRNAEPTGSFSVPVLKGRVAFALVALVPAGLLFSAGFLGFFYSPVEPYFFSSLWMMFCLLTVLASGAWGLMKGRKRSDAPSAPGRSRERELLTALREHGELTPVRASMETSLTVAEADEMLKGLAEGGHLEVRVRGGGLFYSLWEPEGVTLGPRDGV